MPGVHDMAPGIADWAVGGNVFGACLRSISSATTGAFTLTPDGDGVCNAVNTDRVWQRPRELNFPSRRGVRTALTTMDPGEGHPIHAPPVSPAGGFASDRLALPDLPGGLDWINVGAEPERSADR